MDASEDESLNNTSVINTSAFNECDLDQFLECIEELCKKNIKKRPKKRRSRSPKSTLSHHYETLNFDHSGHLKSDLDMVDLDASDPSFNASKLSQATCSSDVTDTDMTFITDQFNDIFRYFNEDVVPDKSLFEDDDGENSRNKENLMATPKKTPQKNMKQQRNRSQMSKKTGSNRELQSMSKSILTSIQANDDFNRKLQRFQQTIEEVDESESSDNANIKMNQTCVGDYRRNNRYNELSEDSPRASLTSSCLSISENDSDSAALFKRPVNNKQLSKANVREKIQFYNNSTSTSRCSSASPFGCSSEDDEYELYRSNSRRRFQQKRQYFENFFDEKIFFPDKKRERKVDSAVNHLPAENKMSTANVDIDRKMVAVQQFVQTRHLLERIKILMKAISKLDIERQNGMNLKKLKKFLIFIRDCAYKCQEVNFHISEEFLSGFEHSVMSAEELLFSVYSAQNQV